MKFDIKDLPYSQFEQLGMSKKDVLTMKAQYLADMLNGNRTGLLALTISLGEGMKPIQADAKLSLSRNPDNTLSLGVHPILAKPTNSIDATPEQWAKMLKGEPIIKESKSYNGALEPHIHQLDNQTNEILSARVNSIQLPSIMKDTILTNEQKDQLKKGLPVEIVSRATKEVSFIRLDLNETKGYKLITEEQAREQGIGNQQKTSIQASTVPAGQKIDNIQNAIFIIHSTSKTEPLKEEKVLAASNEEVYTRVIALAKDYNIKVEKFIGLKESDIKSMRQASPVDYEGKGKIVLISNETTKGIEIKDTSLKTIFDKQEAAKPSINQETLKVTESVSRGVKM